MNQTHYIKKKTKKNQTCNEGTCSTFTLPPLLSREEIQDFLRFFTVINLIYFLSQLTSPYVPCWSSLNCMLVITMLDMLRFDFTPNFDEHRKTLKWFKAWSEGLDLLWQDARCHQSRFITPLLSYMGRENTVKGLWVKIRTGSDHSPDTLMDEIDLSEGSWFNLLPIKPE